MTRPQNTPGIALQASIEPIPVPQPVTTKSAALELAPRGIRVNSVHPGPIATPMLDIRSPEENTARLKSVPMGRQGTAEEVSRLVLFLLSDDSGYMTGSELAIDGGATL